MVIITSSQRQHDRAPPSSSYTILPLCFSSTYTRQSANNNAYHNNTQQQRRVSYITWGKLSLELLSLVVWESLSISALCTPISAFLSINVECIQKGNGHSVQSTETRQNMPGPPLHLHRFSEYIHNTSLNALDIVLRWRVAGGDEKVFIKFIRSSASLARSSCSQLPQLRSLAASCNILINFSDRPFKGSLSFQTKRD